MDWQRYDAGDLTGDEMREAEERLRRDPAAAEEVEGLRKFRRVVRSACLCEPVPTARLEKSMKEVCRCSEAPNPRRRLMLAFLPAGAAVALAAWWIVLGPARPVVHASGSPSLAAAALYPMPPINLRGQGQFEAMENTASAVSYRFHSGGCCLTLTRSRPERHPSKARVISLSQGDIVEDKGSCWHCPTSTYRLTGGTPELRMKWARILAAQTGARRLSREDFEG